jgi:hypothetical protein
MAHKSFNGFVRRARFGVIFISGLASTVAPDPNEIES